MVNHVDGYWGPHKRTVAAGHAEKTPWDAGHGETQMGKAGVQRQGMLGGLPPNSMDMATLTAAGATGGRKAWGAEAVTALTRC